MKARARTPQVLIEAPPAELRLYTAMDSVSPGPGSEAFPDHEAWLAARHAWEAEHKITLPEWYRELCEDVLTTPGMTLPEYYEVTGPYFVEEDDWEDPRLRELATPAARD